MTGSTDGNHALALGKLHGLLAAFAWANRKCNYSPTFTLEPLPAAANVRESLVRYFGESAVAVSVTKLPDWRADLEKTLQRWLFEFRDLVQPAELCSLTYEPAHREMVSTILGAFEEGLQPTEVWSVDIEPRGFYEIAWDDFAVRGALGLFLLHLGFSD